MALGVLALVVGALWTLQGFDILTDSRMSGVAIWSFIGPVVAIAGLILIILGERTRARFKRAEVLAVAPLHDTPPHADGTVQDQ